MIKKILYWALFGCILVIVIMTIGAGSGSAPFITYIKSNSMEPLIKVNDALIIISDNKYQIGDIILYRPLVLNEQYITHRIIDIGDKGYVTKGDNSPYRDQESGEPEITKERIVGKVLTVQGRPLVLPALGILTVKVQAAFGTYSIFIALLLAAIGMLLIYTSFTGRYAMADRRKLRRRYRLRDLYRLITIIAVLTVVISIYIGSAVKQVKYLVSYYPGDAANHVLPYETGYIKVTDINNGLIPVWSIISGIQPIKSELQPVYIPPRSGKAVELELLPHQKIGVYYGYVQIYNYPVLLPEEVIYQLHSISPWLAISAEAVALGLYFTVFFKILSNVHGFEGFIPLKAIKDKITGRRIKHTRKILLGHYIKKKSS